MNKALLGAAVIAGLALSGVPEVVNAGTNGQQIKIVTRNDARTITVTGKNQNDEFSKWVRSGPGRRNAGGTHVVTTNNWWWHGNVTVKVEYSNGGVQNCPAEIPRRYNYDTVKVTCGGMILPR